MQDSIQFQIQKIQFIWWSVINHLGVKSTQYAESNYHWGTNFAPFSSLFLFPFAFAEY